MKENFQNSLKKVFVHEGGWADYPEDPGGATMKGVTLLTFQRYFGQDKTRLSNFFSVNSYFSFLA